MESVGEARALAGAAVVVERREVGKEQFFLFFGKWG